MIFGALVLDPTDPGRKQFGVGETYFVLPAWHELNQIAVYVRRGDTVIQAYIKAGLVELTPPQPMLACIARAMTSQIRWPYEGYRRDAQLAAECAGCWERWIAGPPTGWQAYSDRVTLPIGVTLPSSFYQRHIQAHVRQGVPLAKAYDYTGQDDIRPGYIVDCMDAEMREGVSMAQAAMTCHASWQARQAQGEPTPAQARVPVATEAAPPGEEEEKPAGFPAKALLIAAVVLFAVFRARK